MARAPTHRGIFIVLEGGEGAGKSTHADKLAARLQAAGRTVRRTFEPGATRVGVDVRRLLLDPGVKVDAWTEALLYAADRAQHVNEVIRPALAAGHDVVCDRFVWSSLAYQGAARGLGIEEVAALNAPATAGLEPDVTVVLDIDPAVGLARAGRSPDRIEAEPAAFHAAVRQAFLDLASARGAPVVDASAARDTVADAIWRAVVAAASGAGVAV
jgi:dTMP kinase